MRHNLGISLNGVAGAQFALLNAVGLLDLELNSSNNKQLNYIEYLRSI